MMHSSSIRRAAYWLLGVAAMATMLPASATATPITLQFQGTVTEIVDTEGGIPAGVISLGDFVLGEFLYDPETEPWFSDSNTTDSTATYNFPLGYGPTFINIGDVSFVQGTATGANQIPGASTNVNRQAGPPNDGDLFGIASGGLRPGGFPEVGNGNVVMAVSFLEVGDPQLLSDSAALPEPAQLMLPNVQKTGTIYWPLPWDDLLAHPIRPEVKITFSIDSIAPVQSVPEPGLTGQLVLWGFAGIAGFGMRKRQRTPHE